MCGRQHPYCATNSWPYTNPVLCSCIVPVLLLPHPLPPGPSQPALLQRAAGLLVDLKLLQMDCLEGLAAALREAAAATTPPAAAAGKKHAKKSKQAPAAGGGAAEPEEVSRLLAEAEQLAAELVVD